MSAESIHNSRSEINFRDLSTCVNEMTDQAKEQMAKMKEKKDSMSINDMFELQMIMNKLSQIAETNSAVMTALHSAISQSARAIKGG